MHELQPELDPHGGEHLDEELESHPPRDDVRDGAHAVGRLENDQEPGCHCVPAHEPVHEAECVAEPERDR